MGLWRCRRATVPRTATRSKYLTRRSVPQVYEPNRVSRRAPLLIQSLIKRIFCLREIDTSYWMQRQWWVRIESVRSEAPSAWRSQGWERVRTCPPFLGHNCSWDLRKFEELWAGWCRVVVAWVGGIRRLLNEPVLFHQCSLFYTA